MSVSVTSDEIKQELKATLAARHEVGVAYDDQFVEAFMDKLGAKVAQELQARGDLWPAPPRSAFQLTTERRLKVALISLLLCPAILCGVLLNSEPYTTNNSVLQVCLVLFALILPVNLALNLRLHLRLKR